MSQTDFSFEFSNEMMDPEDKLKNLAESRLRELTEGHTDITGASVTIQKLGETESPYIYKARVVAYTRPSFTAANKKEETAIAALRSALDAVERQVRDNRDRLSQTWKQP